jgi:hypothetical protein
MKGRVKEAVGSQGKQEAIGFGGVSAFAVGAEIIGRRRSLSYMPERSEEEKA